MTLLPFLPAAQLLAAMPMILRLHGAGRQDYAEWLERFEQTLIETVAVSDIRMAARESHVLVARACVHLLDKYRLIDSPALIALLAERSDDIVLAHRALELCVRLAEAERDAFYLAAVRSHFGAIRTVALKMLLETESASREELAIAALLDVQSSVRYVATNYLQATGFDVRARTSSLMFG